MGRNNSGNRNPRATMVHVGVLDAVFNIPPVRSAHLVPCMLKEEHGVRIGYHGSNGRQVLGRLMQDEDVDENETVAETETEPDSPSSTASKWSLSNSIMSRLRQKNTKPPNLTAKASPKMNESTTPTLTHRHESTSLRPERSHSSSKLKKSSNTQRSPSTSPMTRRALYHPQLYPSTFIPEVRGDACSPSQHKSASPTSYSERLQKLQQSIDLKQSQVERDSNNEKVRESLSFLQQELNCLLNTMVANPHPAATAGCLAAKEDVAAYDVSCQTSLPFGQHNPPRSTETQLDIDIPRHHLCSNCHKVRSAQYHQLHPVTTNHKPVHNLCEQCKSKKPASLSNLRFCYSCGVVRSKAFHRKHPSRDAEPNYCAKCVLRVAKSKTIAEETVISLGEVQSDTATSQSSASQLAELPIRGSSVLVKPSTGATQSYYCPVRFSSSNHRRTERANSQAQAYVHPYVQDEPDTVSPRSFTFNKGAPPNASDTVSEVMVSNESESASCSSWPSTKPNRKTKFWNGAFSRRQDVTAMFVETDVPSFTSNSDQEYTRFSRGAFGSSSPITSAGLSWSTIPGYYSPPQSPQWSSFADQYADGGSSYFPSNPQCPVNTVNPEPIIEEPLSPPASPVASPMLLEFATENDNFSLMSGFHVSQ